VGHDTRIGHGAIIMKGVTVGNGAIIGAQSVVTKDVAPYAVVAGAPARFIKWRHPRDIADRLQALAWWDWTHEEIGAALPDFRSLSAEAFLERYENAAVIQPLHSVG
jgi:carbonic anhydrase/acetyltransferase-like protein (isoleucine patch superfamily)